MISLKMDETTVAAATDGFRVGFLDGFFVGDLIGAFEGFLDGFFDGFFVGGLIGAFEGFLDGGFDGFFVGCLIGAFDGFFEGGFTGLPVGRDREGLLVTASILDDPESVVSITLLFVSS